MADTLGTLNPFRYRGYIYDEETELYYVSSRYYDSAIGRWLNADDVAYLGVRGVSDYNLFAYCGNNPIIRYDNGGQFWFLIPAVVDAVYTITCAVVAVVVTYAVYEVATSGNLALELPKISSAEIIPFPTPEPEPESKPEIFVAPSPAPSTDSQKNSQHQAYFPENPYMFKPQGLKMFDIAGTYNGRIIKWMDAYGAVIFEWDEDLSHKPHYHVMSIKDNGIHTGKHYYAGDCVPEPWNSIYFGG